MELYLRLKSFITSWDIGKDEITDLLRTLKNESLTTLWYLKKKINGRYELYFGYDGPFVIRSEEEREALIKQFKEYLSDKNENSDNNIV